MPGARELSLIYRSESYFALGESRGIGYADYFADEAIYRGYFRRKVSELMHFCPPGRVFEIGAAAGFFLDEARRCGWVTSGIEASPWAAAFAREHLGQDVQTATIEELAPIGPTYDAVVALQTIEHVEDPHRMLQWVRAALRPGGILLLTTPDLRSVVSRLMGRWWPSYRPEHLWYFDRNTAANLVRRSGFAVLRVRGDHPLVVPVSRILERVSHYYGPRLKTLERIAPNLRAPVWMGDLELIARAR